MSVLELKSELFSLTDVKPERQKLMSKGKICENQKTLKECNVMAPTKVMMIGSTEEEVAAVLVVPDDLPDIANDIITEDVLEELTTKEENLRKIERRIKNYHVHVRHPPRPGKKCLVLDIDYTLFDHRSVAERPAELARPHLHEFLRTCYEYYDIVIWSATNMKWIDIKMRELKCDSDPTFELAFYLDSRAMISVVTPEDQYGLVDVKPLGVIWGLFPEYTPQNTIHLDDLRRNFLMNPRNGLRIRPFRNCHQNRDDVELLGLAEYLVMIAKQETNFQLLNHSKWERYVRKHRPSPEREERRRPPAA